MSFVWATLLAVVFGFLFALYPGRQGQPAVADGGAAL